MVLFVALLLVGLSGASTVNFFFADMFNRGYDTNVPPTVELRANLSFAPAVSSSGPVQPGLVLFTLQPSSGSLSWTAVWSGLSSVPSSVLLCGPAYPSQIGRFQVDLGQYAILTSPLVGSTYITQEQVTQLLAGLLFVVITSDRTRDGMCPAGGGLRGQVTYP
jgi:hypothetical protein